MQNSSILATAPVQQAVIATTTTKSSNQIGSDGDQHFQSAAATYIGVIAIAQKAVVAGGADYSCHNAAS